MAAIEIILGTKLSSLQRELLGDFLQQQTVSPYHGLAYQRVLEENFAYPNYSLVALQEGTIVGFLPQWKVGKQLESVPWRDKGGPIGLFPSAIESLTRATLVLLRENKLRGVLWKDCTVAPLHCRTYYENVTLDLKDATCEAYWESLAPEERNTIRAAQRAGIFVTAEHANFSEALHQFYQLLVENRRRLGVPVYAPSLFQSYFTHYPSPCLRLFGAYQGRTLHAALILWSDGKRAIDLFSASSAEALKNKANDLLLWTVLQDCITRGVEVFEFGADSPWQKGLRRYKLKWAGKKQRWGGVRSVSHSFWGQISDRDSNDPRFEWARRIFRNLPEWAYLWASRQVVR